MIYTIYEAVKNKLYNLVYDDKLYNLEYNNYKKVLEFIPQIKNKIKNQDIKSEEIIKTLNSV